MDLTELAHLFKEKKLPLETPRETIPGITYCKHNNDSLDCALCAGNELGEALRPLRERYERERALQAEKDAAKRLGKKWLKPKKPKSPVKPGQVWARFYDNTAKEEIEKLTLKILYSHAERKITTKRKIRLANGISEIAGMHGHLISSTALEQELDPFRAILQQSLDKGCVMTVIRGVFMVIPEDWIRYSKW